MTSIISSIAPISGLKALVSDQDILSHTIAYLFLMGFVAEKKTVVASFIASLVTPMITHSEGTQVKKTVAVAFLMMTTAAMARKEPFHPLMACILALVPKK